MSAKLGFVLPVRMNFKGSDLALGNRLIVIAKKHEMSASKVAILALYVGLQVVDENLRGLKLDMEAAGFALTAAGEKRLKELER